jgi:ABC-2 type transport system ATP-binding protein
VRFLSGGEQRRVHTALALLRRPALLLLDEPTAGVDVQTRGDVLALVRELADQGVAVVYSTHYLPEVEALDASVAILDGGRVIARGSVAALVGAHAEPVVELVFEGGDVVRRAGAEPAAVVSSLGADAARLRSLEIVRPSLESVFLGLTGRRWAHA